MWTADTVTEKFDCTTSQKVALSYCSFVDWYVDDIYLQASSIWLYIVPQGIRSLMNYIKQKYGNPLIIITENGKSLNLYVATKLYAQPIFIGFDKELEEMVLSSYFDFLNREIHELRS